MKTVTVRFRSESSQNFASVAAARREIQSRYPVQVVCDDGIYCYRNHEQRDQDDTGARAGAVIDTRPEI